MADFKQCETATDAVLAKADHARALLGDIATNGAGILHNPRDAHRELRAARAAVDAAIAVVTGTVWPTADDYGI